MTRIEQTRPIKALLVGYIGGINVGDEAISGAVAITLQQYFDADVSIISGQPLSTANYLALNIPFIKGIYPGTSITSSQYMNMFKSVKNTDVIVFVGGGILQDVHSTKLLSHCCTMAVLGRLLGKKNIAIGIGAGPISTGEGKFIAATLLKNIDSMVVRDQYSYDYINQHFHESIAKISTGSDSIFLLNKKYQSDTTIRTKSAKIGLCFRCWPQLNIENVINLTEKILAQGNTPVFLAYEHSDLTLFQVLADKFKTQILLSPANGFDSDLAQIRELDGLISMRLHANLFAIMSQTPFVALSYDEKVNHVISKAGYPEQVLPIFADAEQVLTQLQNFATSSSAQKLTELAYQKNIKKLHHMLTTDYKNEHPFRIRLAAGFTFLTYINQQLLMPKLRGVLLFITDKIGHLFPNTLKNKIKKRVGIKW